MSIWRIQMKESSHSQQSKFGVLVGSCLLAVILLLTMVSTLAAKEDLFAVEQQLERLATDFSTSSKSADLNSADIGDTIQYTIAISNSGNMAATAVSMTDTLPAGLTYVTGTLSAPQPSGGIVIGFGQASGVITWTGSLAANAEAMVTFDVTVGAPVTTGMTVTNSADIFDGSATTSVSASTVITTVSVPTRLIAYLPILMQPLPTPTGLVSTRPALESDPTYKWTLSWPQVAAGVSYEIQEAQTADFANVIRTYTTSDLTQDVLYPPAPNNLFFYRIRAVSAQTTSDWSESILVIGPYFDGFGSDTTGWKLVREDTDDTNNSVYYRDDGHLVVKIGGRWDYAIASSLAYAPDPPYRIDTRVFLDDPDNLNGWGFIFGADWDGTECPNAAYTSCFNRYYRWLTIWRGSEWMPTQLKRIEEHRESDNAGQGTSLLDWGDVEVIDEDAYNTWAIEVYPDGRIIVFYDGEKVRETVDTSYITSRHFGLWASTDEYLGSEPWYDYLRIVPIPDTTVTSTGSDLPDVPATDWGAGNEPAMSWEEGLPK